MTTDNKTLADVRDGWPEYLMVRDTGLADDMGGLGQRIFTTAGAGYVKQKYVRADLAECRTLADVQPGGRVRLGDQALRVFSAGRWTYDGTGQSFSHEEMDAAAFVVYRDAALSAQPSQVAYHGDVDLKWLSGSIGEVAHRLSTYMPTGLAEWADRARDCRIAAQVLSELSAQPSPGGQGDELPALPYPNYPVSKTGLQNNAYTASQMQDYARAALAARQPVYEGHTWVSDYVLAGLRERAALPLQLRNGEVWHWQGDGHDFPESLACPVIMSAETLRALLAARQPVGKIVGYMDPETAFLLPVEDGCVLMGKVEVCLWRTPAGKYTKPLYDAPAQTVDLGQFRDAITREYANSRALCDMPRILECERLLALIDGKAVGK